MTGWKIRIPVAAACILAAGYGGYRSSPDSSSPSASLTSRASRKSAAAPFRRDAPECLEAIRRTAGKFLPAPSATAKCWEIIRKLGVADIRSALAELRQEPEGLARSLQARMLLFQWAQTDPQAAAQASLEWPSPFGEPTCAVLAVWMSQDLDAALAWANGTGNPTVQRKAAEMAGRALAQGDPAAAVAKARSISPRVLDTTLRALRSEMAGSEQGRADFAALLSPLPATSRLQALKGMFADWSAHDPQAALVGIESFSGGSAEQALVLQKSALLSWSVNDSAAALDWMDRQAISQAQQLAIYTDWVAFHPDDALPWLAQRKDPGLTAAAVKATALELIRNESFLAADSRAEPLGRLYGQWRSAQPEAAAAWLDQLPADLQRTLANHDGH